MISQLEQAAKDHFGITEDLRETGYILSDGTFLDFSGRHYLNGYERKGDRFVPQEGSVDRVQGLRTVDHRGLPDSIADVVRPYGDDVMLAFLVTTEVVRVEPGAGLSVGRMPSVESLAAFVNGWKDAYGNDEVFVEVISPKGHTKKSWVVKDVTTESIEGLLRDYFESSSMGILFELSGCPGSLDPVIYRFGQELREFINTDPVFSILPEGDWGAGGCWILAEALKRFLGPPAEIWAVYSSVLPVEHVVVKDGDAYFDYNGAQTKKEILSEFAASYPDRKGIGLAPLTAKRAARAQETGIPCEPWFVKPLLSKLNARFGPHEYH